MTADTTNALVAAVWAALDEGADHGDVHDVVDQALHAWRADDTCPRHGLAMPCPTCKANEAWNKAAAARAAVHRRECGGMGHL